MRYADVLDALDRQQGSLAQKEGCDYLLGLIRFLGWLEREPLTRDLLQDIRRELHDFCDDWASAENALSDEVIALRDRLVEQAPEADDSAMPDPGEASADAWRYNRSLAHLDRIVHAGRQLKISPNRNDLSDGSEVGEVLNILDWKFRDLIFEPGPEEARRKQRDDLDDLFTELHNITERHFALHRRWVNRQRSGSGFSLWRLEALVRYLEPEAPQFESREQRLNWLYDRSFDDLLRRSPFVLRIGLYGDLDDKQEAEFAHALADVRLDQTLLCEDLQDRLGTTRSHLLVVERFRQRCQWYDRDELRALAAREKGRPEAALTAHFARYLFDEGLSPISEAITGGLRPDLLDPLAKPVLYVEAKQYERAGKPTLVRAIKQVWDTVDRLSGTAYETSEAFCIVFRRSGPVYVFPVDPLVSNGVRLHLRLIDIADLSESGSRQRQRRVQLRAEELLPDQC
ncbi:MAG: hypothetical protein ABSB24_02190 [Gaiellaceae bacterium]|jgi:hypothetical protein